MSRRHILWAKGVVIIKRGLKQTLTCFGGLSISYDVVDSAVVGCFVSSILMKRHIFVKKIDTELLIINECSIDLLINSLIQLGMDSGLFMAVHCWKIPETIYWSEFQK